MATKQDNPSKIVARLLDEQRGEPCSELGRELYEHCKKHFPDQYWGPPFKDNPMIRDASAAAALKPLDPQNQWHKPVIVAFQKAGLDPNNPLHWRLLLQYFCFAHFRFTRRRRGAPELWNGEMYCRLLQDFDRITSRKSRLSNEAKYAAISNSGNYKNAKGKPISPGRIKTALREARDPRHNGVLSKRLIKDLEQRRGNLASASEYFDEYRRKIEDYCQEIANAWRRTENPIKY
jgi:hypothetical protein